MLFSGLPAYSLDIEYHVYYSEYRSINLIIKRNGSDMTAVHLHAPAATAKMADAVACPDCKRRTRMLSFYTTWYGFDCACIKCGRRWQDGEREWLCLYIRGARQKLQLPAGRELSGHTDTQTCAKCGKESTVSLSVEFTAVPM